MSIPQRNAALILGVVALVFAPLVITAATAHGDPAETVDLADLAEGETRTFGEGEHGLSATRVGDTVVLRFANDGTDTGGRALVRRELRCDLDEDDCTVKVWRSDDGEESVAVQIRGDDGDGTRVEQRVEVVTGEAGPGRRILVDVMPHVRVHERDGDADGTLQRLQIELDALGDRLHDIRIPAIPMTIFPDEGERVLQCPEGDTTMTVLEDEAEDLFHCPKHGLALEPVEHGAPGGFRFHYRIEDGDDDGNGASRGLERL